MGDAQDPKPQPVDPAIVATIRAAIYSALEPLHDEIKGVAIGQKDHAAAVRKYADDMIDVKMRQDRHGRKIAANHRELEAVKVWVGFGPQPAAPALRGGLAPGWIPQGQIRPPSPSAEEWDPEKTSPHFDLDESAALKKIARRDRADSDFWRDLPRSAVLKGFGVVGVVSLTALVTYLMTLLAHH